VFNNLRMIDGIGANALTDDLSELSARLNDEGRLLTGIDYKPAASSRGI
jgi:hypothetical protein